MEGAHKHSGNRILVGAPPSHRVLPVDDLGQEANMPVEIPHTDYKSYKNYESAVKLFVEKLTNAHQKAWVANQQYQDKMKAYQDWTRIDKKVVPMFAIGDLVWINI